MGIRQNGLNKNTTIKIPIKENMEIQVSFFDNGNMSLDVDKDNDDTMMFLVNVLAADIGVPQEIPEDADRLALEERAKNAQHYMRYTVMAEDRYQPVRDLCRNLHERCLEWAQAGECESNQAFMHRECAPVCYSCEEYLVSW